MRFVARGEALQVGTLRSGSVTIGDLTPKVPTADEVEQTISDLQGIRISDTQRALDTFEDFVRMQPSWDGNKRTAMLLANKDLITHGRGLLVVTETNGVIFNDALSQFITDGISTPFQKQLYEQCLAGLNAPLERSYAPIPVLETSGEPSTELDSEPEL